MTNVEHGLRPRWSNLFFPFCPQTLHAQAAAPAHNGEFLWEQFRRAVRPGQIWRTSNSLIRIDRLVHNRDIRRDARYIKFVGAWTGQGPRALRALLPQKDGQFLNSTGPWSVSRRFEPFLLIQSDVRPGAAPNGGSHEIDLQDEATAQYEPLADLQEDPLDAQRVQRVQRVENYPRLSEGAALTGLVLRVHADILDSPAMDVWFEFAQAYTALDQWLAAHVHDRFGQPAFNVKIQRLDLPDYVRTHVLTDYESIVDEFTEEYISNFDTIVSGEYPWVLGTYMSGRSGGWLEVEINAGGYEDAEADDGGFYAEGLSEVISAMNENSTAVEFFNDWWSERFTADADPDVDKEAVRAEFARVLGGFLSQLTALETDVQAALADYKRRLESDEFWTDLGYGGM